MDRRNAGSPLFAVILSASLAAGVVGQENSFPEMPESFDEPMPYFTVGLGPFSRTITTDSTEAQAFFDQGIQLMYSFTLMDAARSFREAQLRDPNCAMCYFGEAWAWGPYMNGPMGAGALPRAQAAIAEALERAPNHANRVERELIDAMAVRYLGRTDRAPQLQADTAYAEAMGRVYQNHKADLDVGFFYAEGLMLLEPRRGSWDIERPEIQRIHGILEEVLAKDIRHPGACHLYIHSTESTTQPNKAEACADFLGGSIPGASHINHMPSHTYNEVGRWGDGVRANQRAWHSDQAAEYGEGFAIYTSHNLHMLLFAASNDGQGAVAIQAAADYTTATGGAQYYEVLTRVRFGRFDDILAMESDGTENPIFRGFWDFGQGYAHLRAGEADIARGFLEAIEGGRASASEAVEFRGHSASDLLGIVGGVLGGEILREEGRNEEAIASFEDALLIEDGLRYDEPEPLNFSVRDFLGAILLEVDRPAEAEAVYREAIEDHPLNGWSLFGLEQAQRDQGKIGEAEETAKVLEASWARSDVWIRSSRF
jgi:tetratricopeptide (TPR) repeat protein